MRTDRPLQRESSETAASDPAFALAVACALADDATLCRVVDQRVKAGFDWARFTSLLQYHLVASLALTRLRACAPDLLPDDVAAELRDEHMQDAAQHAVHLRETIAVVRALEAAGIETIVLKGRAVALMLYPEAPECRPASDIDILVADTDFERADARLVESGYRRVAPEDLPLPSASAMFFHLENVVTYLSPGHGQVIELHRRITTNPYLFPTSLAEVNASAVAIETSEGGMRGLGGPLLHEYLAWHAATAIDCRLKWFADVSRVAAYRQGAAECEPNAGGTRAVAFAHSALGRLRSWYDDDSEGTGTDG